MRTRIARYLFTAVEFGVDREEAPQPRGAKASARRGLLRPSRLKHPDHIIG
jgi:hypothetical protein